ncbi:hypothetical protein BDZ45DRAFT_665973 [Acephala macrosclerotiorum]|nr:hypothetical protein BDZ45DRAFT_665973 [Acephala macrosclerotiorum]
MISFRTNCTLPGAAPYFVSAPNVRGTLEIVWNCLSVLLLCTWSILHLNVPVQTHAAGTYQKHVRAMKRFGKKIKWMMFSLLAPEWLLGKALSDLMSASLLVKKFHEFTDTDDVTWTKSHVFLANMGGFAIQFICQGDTWIVDANQLFLLRKMDIIQSLPRLSEDSLRDRNKSDELVKLFALGQVLWLVIQLITRLERHLPISQLEIVTLSFAACSVFTYMLLLQKPKDVQTSIDVDAARYPTPEEMVRIAVCGPYTFGTSRHHPWIPNNALHRDQEMGGSAMVYMTLGTLFGALIFGAIHCLAWNTTFPTAVERTIWRVASVVTTATTPIEVLIVVMFRKIAAPDGFKLPKYKHSTKIWLFILSIPYGLARTFVFVEIFRSLFYLPVDGFVTTWARNFPHIG